MPGVRESDNFLLLRGRSLSIVKIRFSHAIHSVASDDKSKFISQYKSECLKAWSHLHSPVLSDHHFPLDHETSFVKVLDCMGARGV